MQAIFACGVTWRKFLHDAGTLDRITQPEDI
jgi:hypothetical protein